MLFFHPSLALFLPRSGGGTRTAAHILGVLQGPLCSAVSLTSCAQFAAGKFRHTFPVILPKEAKIYNSRMALLQLALRLLVLIGMIYVFWTTAGYLVKSSAKSSAVAWREGLSGYDTAVTTDLNSNACRPGPNRQYDFQYGSSAYFTLADNRCVELPPSERAVKIGNRIIYYPSYFMEEKTESRFTQAECALLRNTTCSGWEHNNCDTAQYFWGKPCYTESGSLSRGSFVCSCFRRINYMVAGVSHQRMVFTHLYEVQGLSVIFCQHDRIMHNGAS